jgi:hypothetical protein
MIVALGLLPCEICRADVPASHARVIAPCHCGHQVIRVGGKFLRPVTALPAIVCRRHLPPDFVSPHALRGRCAEVWEQVLNGRGKPIVREWRPPVRRPLPIRRRRLRRSQQWIVALALVGLLLAVGAIRTVAELGRCAAKRLPSRTRTPV